MLLVTSVVVCWVVICCVVVSDPVFPGFVILMGVWVVELVDSSVSVVSIKVLIINIKLTIHCAVI